MAIKRRALTVIKIILFVSFLLVLLVGRSSLSQYGKALFHGREVDQHGPSEGGDRVVQNSRIAFKRRNYGISDDGDDDYRQKVLEFKTSLQSTGQDLPLLIQNFAQMLNHSSLSYRMQCPTRFLIIGAQKSGTSSISAYLQDVQKYQSERSSSVGGSVVSMPQFRKELDVFSAILPLMLTAKNYSKYHDGYWVPSGVEDLNGMFEWYDSQFVSCLNGDEQIRGEAVPNYLANPLAPFFASLFVPQAKIVVLVRDPYERAVSAFNMKWQATTCDTQSAWSTQDCFIQLVEAAGKSVQLRRRKVAELAMDFAQKMRDVFIKETLELEKCYQIARPVLSGVPTPDSVKDMMKDTTVRCMLPQSLKINADSKLMEHDVIHLHMALEGAYLGRSIYADQIKLWLKFFPNPKNWLILPASSIDGSNAWNGVSKVLKFVGIHLSDSVIAQQDLIEKFHPRHIRKYIVEQLRADYDQYAQQDMGSDLEYEESVKKVETVLRELKSRVCFFLNKRTDEFYTVVESLGLSSTPFKKEFISCQKK
ncbi:hypothetical protein MP228_003941 [Amoeboaphelidium protococcarum]|nr:hypothetical protein MP228_003941 [Amoeboaphelidium protococcarum]